MAQKKMVKIDGAKLTALFKRRGITLNSASEEIGLSKHYISNTCAWGKMPLYAAKLIETVFNIPIKDFELKEEEIKKPAEEKPADHVEPELVDIDYDKLYRCIYSAAYHAFCAALNAGKDKTGEKF